MATHSHPPLGDVSCRATGYSIQQLRRMGLPTAHLTQGLAYNLDDLQSHSASIPWDDYLVFLKNSHTDLPTDQLVELCTSYKRSAYLRPLLSASGLWFHPAKYFRWVADPESGAIRQLFRCVNTRFTPVSDREVVVEEVIAPGFALPPDIFWETQAIAFGALTTHFGLGPSIVTWEPIERGAAFRVRLPRRRPVRFVLSWLASWFRRDTAEDIRSALSFGHERSLRLEREITERKTVEAARQESEERFRRVTDAVPGVVYQDYLDPDGRHGFVYVSGGATALTGYTPEELIASPKLIWEGIDPDEVPRVRQTILASARNGTPWQQEFRYRTKAGDSRWVRGRSMPDPVNGSGRIVWNGILTDVTAEKQADAELRARDALLQKLSEQVPGFIYQYQQWPDGRSCFPYASEGIRAIYEVTPDEVRGSAATVFARLYPDDLDAVAESIRRSLETLEVWRCEYRVRLPVTGVRWLDGHATPERLPDGSTIWHGYIRDVTDRKLAEDAIRESESRFRTLIEGLDVGVVLQDETDRVLVSNDAAATILGLTPDQLNGVTTMDPRWELVLEDGTPLPPDQVPSVMAARTRRPVRNVVLGTRHLKTGHRTWLQVNATPRLNADGSLRHVLVSLVDITNRKRAEAALRESEARLNSFFLESPVGMAIFDTEGRWSHMNPTLAAINGLPAEAHVGKRPHELLSPELADGIAASVRHILETGEADINREISGMTPAQPGVTRHWLFTQSPILGSERQITGVGVVVIETTALKQAEAALRTSEARLSAVIEHAPNVAIQWYDSDGRVRLWNEASELMYGYPVSEAMGRTLDHLIHTPEEFAHFRDTLAEITRTGRPTDPSEYTFRRRDGNAGVCLATIFKIPGDASGDWFVCMDVDITERKRVEDDLRQERDRFTALAATAPGVLHTLRLRPDGTRQFTYVSPRVGDIFPCPPEELARDATVIRRHIHPDDIERHLTTLAESARALSPINAEYRVRHPARGELWVRVQTAPVREPDGSIVWHGFIIDVTEQKRAEEDIRGARDTAERALADLRVASARAEQFYRLCEAAGQGIGIARLDGTLTYMNPSFRRLLELPEGDDVTKRAFWDLVPSETHQFLADTVLTQTRETGSWSGEFDVLTMSGKRVPIINSVFLLRDPDGAVVGYSNIATDITEQKNAQAALRESELRYRTLIETSSDAIFVMDLSGRILSANPAAVRMHGYSMDELLSMRMQDLDLPDDAADLPDRMRRLRAGESLTFEVVHRRKDGTTFPVEVVASAIEIGGEWLVLAFDRDITERKRAIQSLEEAEYRQRLALDAGRMGTWDWDIEHGRVTWDARQQEQFGFAPGEYDGHPDTFLSRVHPDDVDGLQRRVADSVKTGVDYEAEFRISPRPGTLRWVAGRGRVLRDDQGHPVRMVGVNFDQTDRKQAILALEESERRQHIALDAGRMGTWDWEIGSDRLNWDDREQTLFGFEPGAFDGRLDTFLNRVHPDDLEGVRQVLADAAAGKDFDGEFRIRWATGEVRWVHGSGVVVPKGEQSPPRLIGINYDITDRKLAEQALLEEKGLLQAVFTSLPGIAFAFDQSGRYVRWNHNYETLLGWSDEEMVRITALDTVAPRDRERVAAVIREVFVRGESATELHALAKDGHEIPLFCSGVRVSLGGEPCLVGFGINISDRLTAEAALRESEEQLRIFVENAPVGVAMLDRDLRYLSHSHRWLIDYGLGDRTLAGRLHYEVFPEITDRWKEIHRRCLTGVSERCEQDRFERADGTVDYLRWEIQPWTDATGAVGGLVFFTEMITDRVKAMEQVRASLSEKEAMLKEIHHRVKNNLQVISSLLSLQAGRVTHPVATDVLAESQNRVRAMALVHETLYRSEDLARVDLSRYLEELCGYLFRSYGVDSSRVRLELDVEPVTVSLDKTIPCGLVVNEVVSNSLKYAFPGNRSGCVTVRARMRHDGLLTLTLADDGVGLPADFVLDRTSSLGLQLVTILTEQLGGQLTTDRSGGTRFEITFAP